jgi:hypothetical protein
MEPKPWSTKFWHSRNIEAPVWAPPSWEAGHLPRSLETLNEYAEAYATAAIKWYDAKTPWKRYGSQSLRFLTLLATGLGGLFPILVSTGKFGFGGKTPIEILQLNQFGYLCFGLAALFLALDRFSGASTAWMRYTTTAMALETVLARFRLDWARLTIRLAGQTPTPEESETLLQRVGELIFTVRELVEKETQSWVTEFQTNLSQLEKESKAAIEAARVQVEDMRKEEKSMRETNRPGAIDLTVENVLDTDSGYTVSIDGKTVKENITSKSCGIGNLSPGLHEIAVTGLFAGGPAHASRVVSVASNAAFAVTVSLAKVRVAGGS